jgi:hypothetical protein
MTERIHKDSEIIVVPLSTLAAKELVDSTRATLRNQRSTAASTTPRPVGPRTDAGRRTIRLGVVADKPAGFGWPLGYEQPNLDHALQPVLLSLCFVFKIEDDLFGSILNSSYPCREHRLVMLGSTDKQSGQSMAENSYETISSDEFPNRCTCLLFLVSEISGVNTILLLPAVFSCSESTFGLPCLLRASSPLTFSRTISR